MNTNHESLKVQLTQEQVDESKKSMEWLIRPFPERLGFLFYPDVFNDMLKTKQCIRKEHYCSHMFSIRGVNMSLLEKIRSEIVVAMKSGPEFQTKKIILRQVLSEAQRLNVDDDKSVQKVIRKLIEGNNEAISMSGSSAQLLEENKILSKFLPQTLTIEQIRESLEGLRSEIQAAMNDGQATGIAMKHFSGNNLAVNGKEVGEVVKDMRA